MFLKSIKHVHKLSPSGRERERESEHMWGLKLLFFSWEKCKGYEMLSNWKRKCLKTFIQIFNLNEK